MSLKPSKNDANYTTTINSQILLVIGSLKNNAGDSLRINFFFFEYDLSSNFKKRISINT
jgi:hypothetical protein